MERQVKITHRRAQALLGDYSAGELTAVEYQMLTEHLQVCSICQRDLADIGQIRARLRSFALPVDARVSDSVLNKESVVPPAFLYLEDLKDRMLIPGRVIGANDRQPVRRPFVLLAAALLVCCLLLGTVAIFSMATYQNRSLGRSHPISSPAPAATPRPNLSCLSPTPTPASDQGQPVPTPTLAIDQSQPSPMPTPTPGGRGCATPSPTSRPLP